MKIISKKYLQDMKKFVEQISRILLNQDEFGINCAVDKHTKISGKISISADIERSNIGGPIYIDRSLIKSVSRDSIS